jgi:voltage-gated potassium channel
LRTRPQLPYFPRLVNAGVAQLVEHFLAKEDVESSNLFARSKPLLSKGKNRGITAASLGSPPFLRFATRPVMSSDPATPPAEPASNQRRPRSVRRENLWRIIFLSDTKAGRLFDLVLLWLIALSTLVVMLESVGSIRTEYRHALRIAEWTFTVIFTIEYVLRLWVVRHPWKYARSFFGIVDLLAILPSYLELIVPDTHYLLVLRILRMLRMFRVLKMAKHLAEAGVLLAAIRASREKIFVFFASVLVIVCVEGTIVYVLENDVNPDFHSIPQAIYWAIVTITTVGYGDVAPVTVLGKVMASIIMLTGFAIIAVPTGVVTVELNREMRKGRTGDRRCKECGWDAHDTCALYCQQCGTKL